MSHYNQGSDSRNYNNQETRGGSFGGGGGGSRGGAFGAPTGGGENRDYRDRQQEPSRDGSRRTEEHHASEHRRPSPKRYDDTSRGQHQYPPRNEASRDDYSSRGQDSRSGQHHSENRDSRSGQNNYGTARTEDRGSHGQPRPDYRSNHGSGHQERGYGGSSHRDDRNNYSSSRQEDRSYFGSSRQEERPNNGGARPAERSNHGSSRQEERGYRQEDRSTYEGSRQEERSNHGGARQGERTNYGGSRQDERPSYGGSRQDERTNYGGSRQEERSNHGGSRQDERTNYGGYHQEERTNYGGSRQEERQSYGGNNRYQDNTRQGDRPNDYYNRNENDRGNDRYGSQNSDRRSHYDNRQQRGSYDDRQDGRFKNDGGFEQDSGFSRGGGNRDGGFNRGGHRDGGFGADGGNRDGGFNRGGHRDGGFGRDGGNRDGGFNRGGHRDGGFSNDHGGNRHFQNDGGFGDRSTGFEEPPRATTLELAPRDWVPVNANVDELIDETAKCVGQVQLDQDQTVEIRNSNIETRLTSWANSGLHETLLANINRMGFHQVRPIQSAMIPQILAGYDVVGQAETGGGKTAAFGFPMLHWILNRDKEERRNAHVDCTPFAIVLAPTRELASQIYNNLRTFADKTDLLIRLSYGQMNRWASVSEIQSGCDILVGTCGRIMDLIEKSDIVLDRLKFLVVDEADNLLEKNSTAHINQILNNSGFLATSQQRQTILTSATFNPGVDEVARGLMKTRDGETELVRVVLAKGRLNPRCKLMFQLAQGLTNKHKAIREILKERDSRGEFPKTLVFVEKKAMCDHIAIKLNQFTDTDVTAHTIHGDRPQNIRDDIINKFRRGAVRLLVATDVCSRGIDISDLDRVINFDAPTGLQIDSALDTFIHRIGRCGRLHTGTAHTFLSPDSRSDLQLAAKIVELLKTENREIPDFLLQMGRGGASSNNYGGGFGGERSGGFGGGHGGGFGSNGGGGFTADNGGGAFEAIGFAAANAMSNDENASSESCPPKVPSGFSTSAGSGFGVAAKLKSEEKEKATADGEVDENATELGSSSFGGPAPPVVEKDVEENDDLEDEW